MRFVAMLPNCCEDKYSKVTAYKSQIGDMVVPETISIKAAFGIFLVKLQANRGNDYGTTSYPDVTLAIKSKVK